MNRAQRRHGAGSPSALVTRHALDAVLREAAQLHEAGHLHEAELLYRQVLQRDPANPDALRLLALLAHQLGQHLVAAEYLTAAARSRPYDAQIPTDMGFVQLALGDATTAEQHFRRALEVNPSKSTAYLGLGNAHYARGEHESAVASLQQAVSLEPTLVDAWINLGNSLQAVDRLEEALAAYSEATQREPTNATALLNAGRVFRKAHRWDEAVEAYATVLRLDERSAPAHAGLGSLLLECNRPAEALHEYQAALALSPSDGQALRGVAAAHLDLLHVDDAIESSRAVLALAGDDPAMRAVLADALRLAGRTVEAEQAFATLRDSSHDDGPVFTQLTLLPIIAESSGAMAAARRQYAAALQELGRQPRHVTDVLGQVRNAFYLAYQGKNDRQLQERLADCYRSAAPALNFCGPLSTGGRGATGHRVRVGFASAFLRDHTVGRLVNGIVQHLDRDRFHVSVIHLGGMPDEVSAALDATVDKAVHLAGPLEHLQAEVAALNLDVLIYPEIGMEPRAYFLAFARLAPVQCAMWGHPVTTGIPNVDYFLSSRLLEPEGAQRHYSEKLVLLDRLPAYYQRPERPPADDIRERPGLAVGHHLYACPQSLFKLHPDFDPVVADILRADPAGRLVLLEGMSAHWSELLRRRFAASMPDVADRVVFLPRMGRAAFLGLLQTADVVLDPLHFGGGNSTYEALGLGVPVVTLPGAFMRGRVTAACYQQMGVTDLVASSPEDYVAKALRLVHDQAWRAEMATRIIEASGALFQDDAAVRGIEQFLLSATSGRLTSAVGRAAWAA